MTRFQTIEGSPGLRLDEVAHVFVPGRGRSPDGMDLSPESAARFSYAADVYHAQGLAAKAGTIIGSGYKTPGDKNGQPWATPEAPGVVFCGIPEADAGHRLLVAKGIDPAAIETERYSFDTVTNMAFAEREGHFRDGRPIAIAAHEEHLQRILDVVAPKTLRREYIGVVVPEGVKRDTDGFLPRTVSRLILAGLDVHSPDLAAMTERRAAFIWKGVQFVRRRAYP